MIINSHVSASAGVTDAATEDIWNNIKSDLLKIIEEVCGTNQPTVGIVRPDDGMSMWKKPLLQAESCRGLEDW